MKIKLAFFFLLFLSLKSSAQLSLSETISYIDNKLKETADLKRTYNSQYTYILSGLKFSTYPANKNKVMLSFSRAFSDNTSDELQYIFDPTHISEVAIKSDTNTEAVGMMVVRFIGETAIDRQKTSKLTETTTTSFTFPYLRTDKLNAERLIKAFLLLRDLYKAKKTPDPFLN